jgi:hypothetical protein
MNDEQVAFTEPSEHPDIKPYIDLWAAVFKLGIIDATYDWASERAHKPAVTWVFSDDRHVGSFLWICDVFSLCPSHVRDSLLMKRREIYLKNKGVPRDT